MEHRVGQDRFGGQFAQETTGWNRKRKKVRNKTRGVEQRGSSEWQ